MSEISIYKVVCGDCEQPYFEPDEGWPTCPHCGRTQECVLCMDETKTYEVMVNPFTGEVSLILQGKELMENG